MPVPLEVMLPSFICTGALVSILSSSGNTVRVLVCRCIASAFGEAGRTTSTLPLSVTRVLFWSTRAVSA
jgi:hypothetical protein